MGAHAPITSPFLFFFRGVSPQRGDCCCLEPGRLFVAAYRLVAAGRERVQRPEKAVIAGVSVGRIGWEGDLGCEPDAELIVWAHFRW